ncbi:MAG: hypothetical protein HS113_16470 [Verrucomicrobiales bacterium]|nr:hypothetical protein [Verrucomicrobiales bacterium]
MHTVHPTTCPPRLAGRLGLAVVACCCCFAPLLRAIGGESPTAFAPAPGRLAHWTFNEPGFLTVDGRAPQVSQDVRVVPGVDGLALDFGATNQTARFVCPAVTDDGRTNLTFPQGSIRFLYQPAWSARMPAVGPPYGWGRGPGQRARLFSLQATQDGKTTPLLALSVDADGTNLVLEARAPDGTFRTNRQAAVRWLYPQPELDRRFIRPWREIAVSWSPTQTSLMVEGLLVQDWSNQRLAGPGVGGLATRGAKLHFALGSDPSGDWPAQGLIDEVETYHRALTPLDLYAVRDPVVLNAAVTSDPPEVTLRWFDLSGKPIPIRRRVLTSTNWLVLTNLSRSLSFVDRSPDLELGETYEYDVGNRSAVVSLYGRPVERRGRVLLVVEESIARPLSAELEQFRANLVGDGWSVDRVEAPRHDDNAWLQEPVNRRYIADVRRVKSLIQAAYERAPAELRAVVLIGHVTIPYSGVAYEDGHWDMNGAWPADSFYGDMDGEWSDQVMNTGTNIASPVRRNLPDDGKFDPPTFNQYLTTPDGQHGVELAVGRIDFVRLPAFAGQTEVSLLRRYFQKNHRYRHGQLRFDQTATVGAFFSSPFNPVGRAIHRNGLWTGTRLAGLAGVAHGDAFASPRASLWAMQGGYGAVDTIHNNRQDAAAQGVEVVMSSILATNLHEPRAGFYVLKASYLGEWNFYRDNLLRALLATPTYGLASCWTMDTLWRFETLAAGDTLGSGFVRTARGGASTRTTFLLGDPTLRVQVTAPPTAARGQRQGARAELSWSASPDAANGYVVFRSAAGANRRQDLLTPAPITDLAFTDADAPRARTVYQICAAQLVVTGTGAFTNLSQTAFVILD